MDENKKHSFFNLSGPSSLVPLKYMSRVMKTVLKADLLASVVYYRTSGVPVIGTQNVQFRNRPFALFETFCQQTYSCHALLLSYLSFPHLRRPCLEFNLSLISNTVIYYPKKKAIRIISFSEPKAHPEPLFKSLNLLKFNDVIELQILSFVYQWSHRLLTPCFSEYFKFTSSVHSYSTRQSSNRDLYLASLNTTQYGLRSLKLTVPRLWNSLPTSLTTSNSLRIFRKTLKNSMLNSYAI